MELTDIQKKAVGDWIKEGCSLSEIQRRLAGQLSLPLTYMDVRLLVIDLGLSVKDKVAMPVPGTADISGGVGQAGGDSRLGASGTAEEGMRGSRAGVSVSVDKIVKPGAIVSGGVRFSDGTSARWFIDELGRLAIEAGSPGYKPSMEDVQEFQQEVSRELRKRGF